MIRSKFTLIAVAAVLPLNLAMSLASAADTPSEEARVETITPTLALRAAAAFDMEAYGAVESHQLARQLKLAKVAIEEEQGFHVEQPEPGEVVLTAISHDYCKSLEKPEIEFPETKRIFDNQLELDLRERTYSSTFCVIEGLSVGWKRVIGGVEYSALQKLQLIIGFKKDMTIEYLSSSKNDGLYAFGSKITKSNLAMDLMGVLHATDIRHGNVVSDAVTRDDERIEQYGIEYRRAMEIVNGLPESEVLNP